MQRLIYKGARLIDCEYKNCSKYGNPRAFVKFGTESGLRISGHTATDSAAGYSVSNWELNKIADIECHRTRGGGLVIDYIRNCRRQTPTAAPGPCVACRFCRAAWGEKSDAPEAIGYRCELGRKCGARCVDFEGEGVSHA